ncbi:hypothetical protein GcM3_026042, partial [Golovinomyces cichoracearum]
KGLDQYILEAEGIDRDDSDIEDFVNFLSTIDIQNGHNNRDSYEIFHTECGKFTTNQATSLTQ